MNCGKSDYKDIPGRETEVLKTLQKKKLWVSFSIKVKHNPSSYVFTIPPWLLYGICILMAAPARALPLCIRSCFGSSGLSSLAPSLCCLLSALLSVLHP